MRVRPGFTLIELLAVIVLATAVLGMALPRMSRNFAEIRMQRAASVLASDLRLAHSLAERQRAPVTIAIDPAARIFRVRDTRTPTLVYSERRLDRTSEYPVQQMNVSSQSLVIYPNGLASADLTMTISANGITRTVSMTRAGQVRVQ
jgi:prepilin-type N-terminal cleavage/methylation domain-containing protein